MSLNAKTLEELEALKRTAQERLGDGDALVCVRASKFLELLATASNERRLREFALWAASEDMGSISERAHRALAAETPQEDRT